MGTKYRIKSLNDNGEPIGKIGEEPHIFADIDDKGIVTIGSVESFSSWGDFLQRPYLDEELELELAEIFEKDFSFFGDLARATYEEHKGIWDRVRTLIRKDKIDRELYRNELKSRIEELKTKTGEAR